jgi:hypothetical protein
MLWSMFRVSSTISALFCVALAAAWAGSYSRRLSTEFPCRGQVWEIYCWRGRWYLTNEAQIRLERDPLLVIDERAQERGRRIREAIAEGRTQDALRIKDEAGRAYARIVAARANLRTIPLDRWVSARTPVAIAGVLPVCFFFALAARRRLHLSRVSRCLCPNCRYDLRATPDRCPECGWVRQSLSKL